MTSAVQTGETAVNLANMRAHLIPSKKFKTITIELKFKALINKNTVTKRSMLPFVLRKGSKQYPSAEHIQGKLDDLYGASFGIVGQKSGSYHVLSFHMEIANEKYIDGEASIIADTLRFINEVAFNPNVEDGHFDQDIVKREKQKLSNLLESIKDDKMGYANLRLVEEMSEGELYQVHPYGYEDEITKINTENLYDYYKHIINEDMVDLFIVGDFEEESMLEMVKTHLDGFRKKPTYVQDDKPKIVHNISHQEPKVVIEKDTVQQAKLNIGYRTHTTFEDMDFPAMLLFQIIFGGHPGSKLFLNVREKHSLAYYVSAGLDFFSDKLFVNSGVAPEDYEKACEIIEQQLIAMQQGDFTDEEINEAKSLLVSEHLYSLDDAGGIIDLLYQQIIGNRQFPTEQMMTEITELTKEDIIKSANKLQLDTVYLLTSEEE